MERICNKVKNYKEVENWDIEQHLGMTPEERTRYGNFVNAFKFEFPAACSAGWIRIHLKSASSASITSRRDTLQLAAGRVHFAFNGD